ncbi:hypothetical protein [Piscibacillus halophilus]|uniref:hypothetical protein n=1 Tax=Piscibacillus halophilus TaxID=571933 RepID=UPI00240A56F3|nr:hypothetical protein [Piscibacillus halophilus]
MTKQDDQLLDELKELKVMGSIDQVKKEEMRLNITNYAKKKRVQQRRRRKMVWASTAAAVLLFGVIVMTMVNQQNITVDEPESTTPAEDQDEGNETQENEQVEEPLEDSENETETPGEEEEDFDVEVAGTEESTIVIEGMEEATTVTTFHIKSHNISYQVDELLGEYEIKENQVIHSTDHIVGDIFPPEITVEVIDNTDLDTFVSELDYDGEPTPLDMEENSYEGVELEQGDPPNGYYAYQINDDVLYIQFKYDIEANDGMGPRLQALKESIQEIE